MQVHQVMKESRHTMNQCAKYLYAPPLTKALLLLSTGLLVYNQYNVLVLTLKTSNRIHLEPP